jgi:hypothetical protein
MNLEKNFLLPPLYSFFFSLEKEQIGCEFNVGVLQSMLEIIFRYERMEEWKSELETDMTLNEKCLRIVKAHTKSALLHTNKHSFIFF